MRVQKGSLRSPSSFGFGHFRFGDDASVLDAQDEAGEAAGLGEAVGDVEDGDAGLAADGIEEDAHFLTGLFVEGAQRFVEAEDAGAKGEGAPEGDALGLAAAEALRLAVEEVGDAEEGSEFGGAGVDGGAIPVAQARGEGEMLAHRHGGEKRAVLRDVADSAGGGFEVCHVAAEEVDGAGAGGFETADGLEQGGFPAAGGAHEDGVDAGGDREGNALEGEGARGDGELIDGDHGSPDFLFMSVIYANLDAAAAEGESRNQYRCEARWWT